MIRNQLSWMIGGPQGSGINITAEVFAKACYRSGLNVFANIEYRSNIKGEHSYYQVRVSEQEIHSHVNQVDLLIALDKETIVGDIHKKNPTHPGHRNAVIPGTGGIILDSDLKYSQSDIRRDDIKLFQVPFKELLTSVLKEFGKEKERSKYQIVVNTLALGVSTGILRYDLKLITEIVRESFADKMDVADINAAALEFGYKHGREHFSHMYDIVLEPVERDEQQILMRGVHAVALGKLKAGCGFHTYYPITPATDESDFLERHQEDHNIIVVQSEDEISAICMASGAAHAGLRAATSTSGPGFSLMVETLGWAGATEAPGPVVFLYQRGSPSSGLPTHTEQGDLRFALHASHGEFPRILIAPGDVVEVFYDAFEAFNLAERFQMPVIVMLDRHLAGSYETVPFIKTDDLKIDRGRLLTQEKLDHLTEYKRYLHVKDGISPRSIPGQRGGIFWAPGEEHDEQGHLNEGSENRVKMMKKRMQKMKSADLTIPVESRVKIYGDPAADVSIIGWGSTKGAIRDALEKLNAKGQSVNFLQIRYIHPFPSSFVEEVLSRARKTIIVESNYSAQLGGIIRERTGKLIDHRVLRFDGRPFSRDDIFDAVSNVITTSLPEVVVPYV